MSNILINFATGSYADSITMPPDRAKIITGVSSHRFCADGERTVKTSGESDQVYVNGVFSGGSTNTAKFSLYVSPYLVANQGGRYTKHIYAGSQRIVSKVGDFASYGSDPRRIEYAGANTDGLSVDYKSKYAAQQQVIKNNYKFFDVPYNGTDNDNYADGEGFCCNDGSMEAAVAEARKAQTRAVSRSFKDPDNYENLQFFYHSDHLGSSSFITNLDGEVVQHIEYVPFGEVFIEERNNVWNTPYLFNAKELDEETGMYYYGARYYDPRLSLWMSTDPLEKKYSNISPYCYTFNNPISFVDPDGRVVIASQSVAQSNISNTLSLSERAFISFNSTGELNIALLNNCKSSSENFTALKALANSSINYIFSVADKNLCEREFFEKGSPGHKASDYFYGSTHIPSNESDPSPDNNVYVVTASFLSEEMQVRNTAHEGYGHAYFFELKQSDKSINPNHTYEAVGFEDVYDEEFNITYPVPIFGKSNHALENQITIVENQAVENYRNGKSN